MNRPKKPTPPKLKVPKVVELELLPSATLAVARDALARGMLQKDAHHAGVICPLCRQQATIYYRSINRSIARVLAALYRYRREVGPYFAHVPTLFKEPKYGLASSVASQGGQWAQAAYWGLVERERTMIRDDGSSRTGYARITDLGIAFLQGRYRIRKYALIYNAELLGKAGEPIGIHEVKNFDYREAMGGEALAPADVERLPDEELYVRPGSPVDVSSLVHVPADAVTSAEDDAEAEYYAKMHQEVYENDLRQRL
jgi:hypothetical protein